MRNRGDRFITPLMVLSLMFLVAGLHDLARSSPGGGEERTPAERAQTRPAQTQPSRPKPSKAAKPSPRKKAPEKPIVFTDEDLAKYHDPSASSTRPAPPQAPTADPLKTFTDQQERSRWRQEKIGRLQQRIVDLQAKLKGLEQKRLSVANPLVPRPPESEAQKAEEKGLSGPELMARTDEETKQTSQELESAQKELADFLATTPE